MKLCTATFLHHVLFVTCVFLKNGARAFAPTGTAAAFAPRRTMQRAAQMSSGAGSSADFGSDFASAMPEKPKQTMQEYLQESADRAISSIRGSLADGVDPPKELEELQVLRDDQKATTEKLAMKIYELMIERGMLYDEDPDTGLLTPTEFDIQSNLDVPEVKEEFDYNYRYGMTLITKGLVSVDNVKKIVQERLIPRTGLTPEQFDEWLGF